MKKLTLIFFVLLFSSTGYTQKETHVLSGKNSSSKIIASLHPEFSFLLPEMAGNLKFGIINRNKSKWLSDLFVVECYLESSSVKYKLQDPILGEGELIVTAVSLSSTDGLVLQIEAKNLPEEIQLFWSFGGSFGKIVNESEAFLKPEYCKYNVFSVEGSLFTVYYGESMKLKVFQGVVPLNSEIRLSDAFQQSSPLIFFNSGKKTLAPALTCVLPLKKNDKQHFGFYRQKEAADYNSYMLSELFSKAVKRLNSED